MITDYEYRNLFYSDFAEKNYIITDGVCSISGSSTLSFGDYTVLIQNDELSSAIKIHEFVTDEDCLNFGESDSSYIEFSITASVLPLKGKELKLYIYLNEDVNSLMLIGNYKVTSDKPTANRDYRDIIAYDRLYDFANTNVASWYENLFVDDDSYITVREMRESLLSEFNLVDDTDTNEMLNDNVPIYHTMDYSNGGELFGSDILYYLNAINGCFGHINRKGHYVSIRLKTGIQTIYPSPLLHPSPDLYPTNPVVSYTIEESYYKPPVVYEDYVTKITTGVQIREDDDDQGVIVGTDSNVYIMEGNFLLYGKSLEELTEIANNILLTIKQIHYRPVELNMVGDLCLEVGDPLRIVTNNKIIYSYILSRELTLETIINDHIESTGLEERSEQTNNVSKEVSQLKGKTFKLESTVDGLNLRLSNIEDGSATVISVMNGNINAEITRATESEGELASYIQATSEAISLEVARASSAEQQISSSLSVLSNEISAKVESSGGDDRSFSWTLNLDGWTLKSNSETIFKCDENGSLFHSVGSDQDVTIEDGAVRIVNGNVTTAFWDGGIDCTYLNQSTRHQKYLWAGVRAVSGGDGTTNHEPMIILVDEPYGTPALGYTEITQNSVSTTGSVSCSEATIRNTITLGNGELKSVTASGISRLYWENKSLITADDLNSRSYATTDDLARIASEIYTSLANSVRDLNARISSYHPS